jgi:hypothetical protein
VHASMRLSVLRDLLDWSGGRVGEKGKRNGGSSKHREDGG